MVKYVFQTIEKLENMVDGGNYYEAQQMYKSTSARYCLYDNLFFSLICRRAVYHIIVML
jgi:hypothetical protein